MVDLGMIAGERPKVERIPEMDNSSEEHLDVAISIRYFKSGRN